MLRTIYLQTIYRYWKSQGLNSSAFSLAKRSNHLISFHYLGSQIQKNNESMSWKIDRDIDFKFVVINCCDLQEDNINR